MQKLLVLVLLTVVALLAFDGCARFSTNQVQNDTIGPDGTTLIRTTSTKVSATTFFEAKSAITAFKAAQTDKSQGATVGGINQEASSTNLTAIIGAMFEAAVSAAAKATIPKP